MEISRSLYNDLKAKCFKGKVILLLGARQVGKTSILKKLQKEFATNSIWLNADEGDVLAAFEMAHTSTALLQLIGPNNKLVIIDEAQQIKDIGKKLKLLYDTYPDIQVIATGSSAFDLQNETSEPLTGRKIEFFLYPLSFQELSQKSTPLEERRMLETRLVYGSYPEVINNPGHEKDVLNELANSYLYKDILRLDGIRKSAIIQKLLQALALQLGSEVNFSELSRTVGNINNATVEKYLDILEKAYVIFQLPALNRNMRTEIKKGKKYYFNDNGIRNLLIKNYNPLALRQDTGALWENYLIAERGKLVSYNNIYCNRYFWRTKDQAEIDYIEEREGKLHAFEIKWTSRKAHFPKSFLDSYPENITREISRENYQDFLGS